MRNTISTTHSILASLILIALLGICAIGGAQEDTWTRKADMPTARAVHATGVVDGKIYVIGGGDRNKVLSSVEEYNPLTNTWTKRADMPTARMFLTASAVNGKIYAIGGVANRIAPWIPISTVEEYDPSTDTWTRKTDTPMPRGFHSAGVVNGKIYVIGGSDNINVSVPTVEE